MKDATVKKAIIMVPGELDEDVVDNEEKYKPKNNSLANLLKMFIKAGIGEDVDIKVEPYPYFEKRLSGPKDQGIFIVRVSSRDNRSAKYKTWFSEDKF